MRFAVIGTGAIVEKFISAGSQVPGFSLYAVYSRSKERGQAFAAEHGAQRSFDNLADLAACRKGEAVYIASPNYAHCAQALAMLWRASTSCAKSPWPATRPRCAGCRPAPGRTTSCCWRR